MKYEWYYTWVIPWKEYSFLVLDLEKSEWNKDEHQSVSPLRNAY